MKRSTKEPWELDNCPVTNLPITKSDEWTKVDLGEGYSATFTLIGDRILLSIPYGNSGRYGMMNLISKRSEFLKCKKLNGKKYVEIRDYRNTTGHTREGREQFTEHMLKEGDKGELLGYWGYNATLIVKLIFNIGLRIHKFKFKIGLVDSYDTAIENAYNLIQKNELAVIERPNHSIQSRADSQLNISERKVEDEIDNNINSDIKNQIKNLLQFIGNINWEIPGLEYNYNESFEDSEFKPLYEAISLIKYDYDAAMQIKNLAENDLESQIKNNLLRAEIWKIAADKSLNENEQIQKLLNKVGEAIGVSRACYKKFTGDNTIDGDLITVLEWCDKDAKPTLGDKIPKAVLRHFMNRNYYLLFSESTLEVIPKPFRKAAKIVINRIFKLQNIEYAFVIPFYIFGKIEGWLSFDVCKNKKQKTVFTEDIRNIIIETATIISSNAEQRRAEISLKENEERLRILFEFAPDAYYINDFMGNFIDGNKAAEKLLGYKKEELTGKNFLKLNILPKLYLSKAVKSLGKNMLGYGTGPDEFLLKRKDGTVVPVLITTYPIKIKDKSVVLGIAHDITEYKKAEQKIKEAHNQLETRVKERTKELAESNKRLHGEIAERKQVEMKLKQARVSAEKANNAKSEFLANMSHEIRTPLNAIIGFTDILNSLISDKEQLSYLEAIKSSSENLLNIINDILDLSKIEAKKVEVKYALINLNSIFNEIQNIFSLIVKEKKLKFKVHIAKMFPESFIFDEIHLRQILFNLVGNAVKFTNKGGIMLSAEAEFYDENTNTFDLIIKVRDTGIGISKENQELIFEPFKQQKNSQDITNKGTGLGLAITKRFTELLNGEITVESEINQGSVFKLVFRNIGLASESKEFRSKKPELVKTVVFDKATILVADDLEESRNIISTIFRKTDVNVISASNGEDAIQKAKNYLPDVILMDIRMPDMDGYKAFELIRNNINLKHIPVVAFTAYGISSELDKIKKHGFNGLLIKPIQVSSLYEEMMKYIKYKNITDTIAKEDIYDFDLSIKQIKKIPEIVQAIKCELIPIWEKNKSTIVIRNVELFVNKAHAIAKETNFEPLLKISKQLNVYIKNYDIEKIKKILSNFPEFINNLENYHIK